MSAFLGAGTPFSNFAVRPPALNTPPVTVAPSKANKREVAAHVWAHQFSIQIEPFSTDALLNGLVAEHKIERVTPHDLRRTCLTWITRLGFGRDAMDRIANHRTSTVTDVYDRHGYADEDKRIMAAVARHVTGLVDGTAASNVVSLR